MATAEERIAVLETLVAELRAEFARPPRRDSMMQTLTCPGCGGGSLVGVREVKEFSQSGLVPLALGNQPGFLLAKKGAPLQAYVCRRCRLVEWHIATLENLVIDGNNVIAIERPAEPPPPSDAPYR